MKARMTIYTETGVPVVFNSDQWRKEGNLLIVDHKDLKDNDGAPRLYGQVPDWTGFIVEYVDE